MHATAELGKAVAISSDITAFSSEEALKLFDESARRYMGMSGNEFLSAWDAGNLSKAETRVMRVAILIPLVRKIRARKQTR